MKKFLPALVLVLCGQSFADCNKMEFAEMQAMSKEQLLIQFCSNRDQVASSVKHQKDLMEIAKEASSNGNHNQAQQFMADVQAKEKVIAACENEQTRMMRAAKTYLMCPPK